MATDKQEYHQACIEDLQNGNCGYEFTVESGRKYHKIMMSANGSRSVHASLIRKLVKYTRQHQQGTSKRCSFQSANHRRT